MRLYKKSLAVLAVALGLAADSAYGKIYFQETFNDGKWADRWVKSTWKVAQESDGDFEVSLPDPHVDEKFNLMLHSKKDARFYTYSALFDEKFSNKGKEMYIQYQMRKENTWRCGGAYLKLGPKVEDRKTVKGSTEYNVMFGPDACGSRRVHAIFNYGGKNLDAPFIRLVNEPSTSHIYRMTIWPNNSYVVETDNEILASNNITQSLPPLEIDDPEEKKPESWDDKEMIPDPEDKKPEDWVDEATIPDSDAKKPDDWDDEEDGVWEAPRKANPDFKGAYVPKKIKNPNYQGIWTPRKIANPNYPKSEKPQKEMYAFDDFEMVTFDLWQVDAQFYFDNIVVADSAEDLKPFVEEWKVLNALEKEVLEKKKAEKEAAEADSAPEVKVPSKVEEDDDDVDDLEELEKAEKSQAAKSDDAKKDEKSVESKSDKSEKKAEKASEKSDKKAEKASEKSDKKVEEKSDKKAEVKASDKKVPEKKVEKESKEEKKDEL